MKKSIDELNIKTSNKLLLSIEIDTDTLSEINCCKFIEEKLPEFAKANPDLTVSLYDYITQSADFFYPTLGLFYAAAGSQKLFNFLYKNFKSIPNIRILKQYFSASRGKLAYHIENGQAWRREDMVTFALIYPEK